MKIIKIGASWCSGCVVMRPIWEKIEKEYSYDSKYYDFDVYEDFLKQEYHIGDKLPIVIFLNKQNQELERIIGEISYDKLKTLLDKYGDQ